VSVLVSLALARCPPKKLLSLRGISVEGEAAVLENDVSPPREYSLVVGLLRSGVVVVVEREEYDGLVSVYVLVDLVVSGVEEDAL
jgi:hypothetical protein